MIKVYNSLTFKKEEFKTLKPNEVLMYVCGPTVYDSPHLGHAKSAVAFDIIRCYLKFKGYNVKMVKNYTDIDDKIIKRANERNIDFNTLSEQYIKEYEEVMKILNIQKDFKNPRATEVIDFMIEFIEKLISKGYAYESNGSVYYSVKSFPKYKTVLQNISEQELESEEDEELEEEDITYADDKRALKDFALWKKSKEGEPFWESPWGKGRPGWHIECSAMAINFLGETIDVHGGGQDLKFPHHRNEIAQSEAYTNKPFAKYFMHNGFVNVDNEKMSKSLGNFFLVTEVVKQYDPMVVRFFLISSHYRKSINYSMATITQAKKNYDKIINTIEKINLASIIEKDTTEANDLISKINNAESRIMEAMDDDFNTPVAIAEIMTIIRELNNAILEKKVKINEAFKDRFFSFIKDLDKIFGLFPNLKRELRLTLPLNKLMNIITELQEKLLSEKIYDISDDIHESLRDSGESEKKTRILLDILSDTRAKLRKRKAYKISDYIREELGKLGIKVEDY
ncbi:MAG: cysteine--tRNA ligase [Candidatus Hodarchaeota archaeon]